MKRYKGKNKKLAVPLLSKEEKAAQLEQFIKDGRVKVCPPDPEIALAASEEHTVYSSLFTFRSLTGNRRIPPSTGSHSRREEE